MSDMHAETASWIDGLRARCDKAETAMARCSGEDPETHDADRRLKDLRARLDAAERDDERDEDSRTALQKMTDDLESTIARALSRIS